MRRRRDAEARFDHAPAHHAHVVCARGVNDAQRFDERTAFRELEVHTVDDARELRDVGRDEARLIRDDRQRRAVAHELQSLEVLRRQRLFHELDAEFREQWNHLERALRRPPRVRVDAQDLVRRRFAHDANDFLVAIGAELDLENRILLRFRDARAEFVVARDADRVARARGARRREAPQFPHRHAEPLAGEVVQRRADGAPRRRILVQRFQERGFDVLDRERVDSSEDGRERVQRRDDRLRGLAVVRARRGFTPALDAVLVRQFHPHRRIFDAAAARNDERMFGAKREQLVREAHRNSARIRRAW